MKILITGAKGQLGKKIYDIAVAHSNLKLEYVDIDDFNIANENEVKIWFENNHYDIIVNCAAYTAVEKAEVEENTAFIVNARAVEYLAKQTKKYNAKLIHISTDYVFDGTANTPYNENFSTNPISVYGKTKLKGEELACLNNDQTIIIRTAWLYSEYGNNFCKTMINLAKERDVLKVVYDQVGTPTYAGDLAKAIIEVINQYDKTQKWEKGIYHFSNLGVCSWYDFAVEILKNKNVNTKVIPVLSAEFPTKVKRPTYSVLDKAKFINTFNYNIPYWKDPLVDMLKKL